jgi:hypothetical protein
MAEHGGRGCDIKYISGTTSTRSKIGHRSLYMSARPTVEPPYLPIPFALIATSTVAGRNTRCLQVVDDSSANHQHQGGQRGHLSRSNSSCEELILHSGRPSPDAGIVWLTQRTGLVSEFQQRSDLKRPSLGYDVDDDDQPANKDGDGQRTIG